MCGILGLVKPTVGAKDIDVFGEALNTLVHRGPDFGDSVQHKVGAYSVLQGHRRLAIIDLSDAGRQPMQTADGKYSIIFNGMIYNYIELRALLSDEGVVFHTQTDTEVLLAAWAYWGRDCLNRFEGIFAFAVLDHSKKNLTCVTDPFGIKPLYYSQQSGSFGFASELKPLLKLYSGSLSLNYERAYAYLVWGQHDVGPNTFLNEISRLAPGTLMEIDLAGSAEPKIQKWWKPNLDENKEISFSTATDRIRDLFLQSVRMQLRSDVPVGFALSGGVDSSSIVCAARYLEPDLPIRTFSYVATDKRLNEQHWIDIVNDRVGAISHMVNDSDEDFDLETAIEAQGEPFGGTSILASYNVFRRMKAEGIIVSLDGQGADEMLGGYSGYPQAKVGECIARGEYLAVIDFVHKWSRWPGRGGAMGALKLLGDVFTPGPLRKLAMHSLGYDVAPKWLDRSEFEKSGASIQVPLSAAKANSFDHRQFSETLNHALSHDGLPRLLRYADRNSMAFSIESRVPFLSPELVAFSLSLPSKFHVSGDGQTKNVFRSAMRGIVPDEILDRKDKIGFETPELDLLQRQRDSIFKWIAVAEEIPFLDRDMIRKTVVDYLNGNVRYRSRCWRIINYCRWYSSIKKYLD